MIDCDLIEKLRKRTLFDGRVSVATFEADPLCHRAASRIERLETALARIADGDAYHDGAAKFMAIAKDALEK